MLATLSIDKTQEWKKRKIAFHLLSFGGQKAKSDVMIKYIEITPLS
jgi:hypothetical protein